MAQRWTLALILIYLTVLTTLITAFRVRDFPKSSHDSAKKKENCENCDVKFGQKWHSGNIKSDEYSHEESEEGLPEKQRSDLNKAKLKSSNKEENPDNDNDDFGFLRFKAGLQEYPKEALNKLEEKLEIISKSFWNLFGDVEVDEYKDEDIDDDDDDELNDSVGDDYEYDDEDIHSKIPSVLKKSKLLDLKRKTDMKIKPSKQLELTDKLIFDKNGGNNAKIDNHVESKAKIIDFKHEAEIPTYTAHGSKYKSLLMSKEDSDDDNDNNDYIDRKISDDKTETKIIDIKKKMSTTITQSTENSLPREKNDESKNKVHNVEKVRNKRIKNLSKQRVIKTNVHLKLKDPNKIASKDETSDDDHYIDDDNDVDDDDGEEEDDDDEEDSDVDDDNDDDGDVDDDDDDNNQDNRFVTPKYKDIIKEINLKGKQSSKETKDIEILNIMLKDNEYGEDDSNKDRRNVLVKTQPDKIIRPEEDLKGKDLTSNKINDRQSDEEFKTLHKNLELKKEVKLKEVISKETTDYKSNEQATDTFSIKNKHLLSSTSVRKEETKHAKNVDGVIKKETIKLDKNVDDDGELKSKSSREKKDKIHETSKITKTSEITEQNPKEDNLKKSGKKAKEYKQNEKESTEQFAESQEGNSKGESNLKHITEALHRRSILKSEFEDFYTFLPTFAPNFSRIHNPECRRHGQIMLRQLRGSKLWALNMLDATAKIPSGLLQGNGIQLGDFEQCLASRARVQLDTGSVVKVQGKYCLAWIDVKAEHPELETPVHLAQAKNLIKSRIDDPGHFVPRFSTLSWGVCVPSPCEPEDVEVILRDAIRHYQRTTGLVMRIKVNEQDCHTKKGGDPWEKWLELPTALTLSFYGIIIGLVCVATVQDFVSRKQAEETRNVDETNDKTECDQKETKTKEENLSKQSEDLLSVFSLYRTMKKLTAPGTTDDISCIHGVRAIATIALLVAHKFMPVAVMPYTNRLKITETVSSALWSWCRAGWIFTDCFLLLSGALTAYRISIDSQTGAPKRILFRYLRLTPSLLAVVLFYAYVWDNISTGPMWGTFVTKNAEVCQEGWWWNVLYVQNYIGFENMCAPQTHQLALDMQLTILGGIIVWLVQEKGGYTKIVLPAIHILAAYSRYNTVRDHRLTLLAYHGVSVSQLYRTARLSYTSVLHRSTPYLVGISLGIALKKPSRHGKLFLTVGWIVSGVLWGLVWWAGFDSGSTQFRYNATSAAQYAALTPIASAIPIAWLIYAVHSGCNDFLSRLFCSYPLVLISRLSYAIYLCQFIIFITSIGTVKTSSEFSVTSLFDVQEISGIILLSTIITLTLVIPMQSLPKFLFPSNIEISETKIHKVNNKIKNKPPNDLKRVTKEEKEPRQIKQIQKILVHREVLKEIPESEIEYEAQRDILEGILEEEENEEEMGEEEYQNHLDDDLVIIEGEVDEESWGHRENEPRYYSREEDNEVDEWEWTANGQNGAQYLRYSR